MATRIPTENKPEKQDFELFEAIEALDKKDYGYWDRLSSEQQRKFIPYMLMFWMSSVSGATEVQQYYLMNSDQTANKHLFNEAVQRHPKLQWLMLCSISPGLGKQYHQWVPQLSKKLSTFEERATPGEVSKYYSKIYRNASKQDIQELVDHYVDSQHRKVYLARQNPTMKSADIELLSMLITPEDIEQYEKDNGN